jgi:hypothetical protein
MGIEADSFRIPSVGSVLPRETYPSSAIPLKMQAGTYLRTPDHSMGKGHANEHKSPRLAKEGGGVEIVSTSHRPCLWHHQRRRQGVHQRGSFNNGISENTGVASSEIGNISYAGGIGPQGGVIAPPRPEDLDHSVGHIGDLIGGCPKTACSASTKPPATATSSKPIPL